LAFKADHQLVNWGSSPALCGHAGEWAQAPPRVPLQGIASGADSPRGGPLRSDAGQKTGAGALRTARLMASISAGRKWSRTVGIKNQGSALWTRRTDGGPEGVSRLVAPGQYPLRSPRDCRRPRTPAGCSGLWHGKPWTGKERGAASTARQGPPHHPGQRHGTTPSERGFCWRTNLDPGAQVDRAPRVSSGWTGDPSSTHTRRGAPLA